MGTARRDREDVVVTDDGLLAEEERLDAERAEALDRAIDEAGRVLNHEQRLAIADSLYTHKMHPLVDTDQTVRRHMAQIGKCLVELADGDDADFLDACEFYAQIIAEPVLDQSVRSIKDMTEDQLVETYVAIHRYPDRAVERHRAERLGRRDAFSGSCPSPLVRARRLLRQARLGGRERRARSRPSGTRAGPRARRRSSGGDGPHDHPGLAPSRRRSS